MVEAKGAAAEHFLKMMMCDVRNAHWVAYNADTRGRLEE